MPENKTNDKDIEDNKFLAAIAYIWILFIIPLFLKKDSKFAQFHAKQAMIVFILEVAAFLTTFIGIGWILYLVAIVYVVLGIRAALDGKYWELPIIGKYAKKINL